MESFAGGRNNEGMKDTFHTRRLWEGSHGDKGMEASED
jgi:hypothetical protein